MIWLRNSSVYMNVAEYDHDTGNFTIRSRDIENTDGSYEILSEKFVALYQFQEQIFIRLGDERILLDKSVKVDLFGPVNNRRLTIEKAGRKVAQLEYEVDTSDVIPDDITPYIEAEHFDFGLFLSNVSKDEIRQRVLLGDETV